MRDAKAHHRTFAVTPEYLEGKPRGLAAGAWPMDYIDLLITETLRLGADISQQDQIQRRVVRL